MEINNLTSPCGIYCGACPSFQKGSCLGCRSEDCSQKRTSKWQCKIRKCCFKENKLEYCGQCHEFPCKELKRKLINSHLDDPRFNYRHNIPENMVEIKKLGLVKWSQKQEKLWRCLECGKPLVFYHNKCSGCGKGINFQIK